MMTTSFSCAGGGFEGAVEGDEQEEEEDMEAWAVLLADSRMTGGKGVARDRRRLCRVCVYVGEG